MLFQTTLHFIEIVFFFAYFSLLGIFFQLIVFNKTVQIQDIIKLNLFGLFIHYILLTIWNILFPINIYFYFSIVPILIFSIITIVKQNSIYFDKGSIQNPFAIAIIIQLIITIWVANLAMGPLIYEPMYYLQKIRWAQEYSLVYGLGNLFDHYGLDSYQFLNFALFDSLPFLVRPFWTLSGYFLCLGLMQFFTIPIFNQIKNKGNLSQLDIFQFLFTIICINYCFYFHPSLGTDLPIFIFGSFLALELYKYIFYKRDNLNVIFILIALGFISKISFLLVVIFSILIIIVYKFNEFPSYFKKYKLVMMLVLLVFFLQFHRNISLTGYPLYPFALISMPVKWKVEKDVVIQLEKGISDWAKGLRGVETNPEEIRKIKREWIKTRLFVQHRRVETLYPVVLGLAGFLTICFFFREKLIMILLFIIPPLAQIGMWYFHAPDTRFSSFAFWWIGAGLGSFAIKKMIPQKWMVVLPLGIIIISFSIHAIDFMGQKKPLFVSHPSYFIPKYPPATQFETDSGLKVWIPENGAKCDDCPLPCTQAPSSLLKLRTEGKINGGFLMNYSKPNTIINKPTQ